MVPCLFQKEIDLELKNNQELSNSQPIHSYSKSPKKSKNNTLPYKQKQQLVKQQEAKQSNSLSVRDQLKDKSKYVDSDDEIDQERERIREKARLRRKSKVDDIVEYNSYGYQDSAIGSSVNTFETSVLSLVDYVRNSNTFIF